MMIETDRIEDLRQRLYILFYIPLPVQIKVSTLIGLFQQIYRDSLLRLKPSLSDLKYRSRKGTTAMNATEFVD